ncbi:hypothetical protein [Maritimibacter sp. UBA3975]|uniref:hypothetical protein n=1 Tax=Maritimibacter sp. UBA3975 TaxID=1946833 RepID=UPI0025BE102B|nr:hypothetical protein [Maritimibacter sp. UBA3975]
MTKFKRITMLAIALTTTSMTAGCLRNGVASVADPAATAALVFEARTNSRDLFMETTTMPTTGGATYAGYATGMIKDMALDSTGGPQQIGRHFVGDASFDVSFSSNDASFSGDITNILAKDDVDQRDVYTTYFSGSQQDIEDMISGFDPTTGSIRIANGALAPTATSPNAVASDVSGSFTHNGDTLEFGGRGRGFFFGADGEGLNVNAETNDGLTITENGATRVGDFGATTVDSSM